MFQIKMGKMDQCSTSRKVRPPRAEHQVQSQVDLFGFRLFQDEIEDNGHLRSLLKSAWRSDVNDFEARQPFQLLDLSPIIREQIRKLVYCKSSQKIFEERRPPLWEVSAR